MSEISMIMTSYNRARLLGRSLSRLKNLTLPDEIIVVDDGGSDDTRDVCSWYAGEYQMPITYVYNDRPGYGNRCQPTNVAIKLAMHDLILHTEPEVEFLTDVVRLFGEAVDSHPDDILAPWYGLHDSWEECEIKDCFVACPGNGLHDNGGNAFLYRRSWIEEIGGWDESLEPGGYDDIDFHMRLSWIGHRQVPISLTEIRHRWHDTIPWNAGSASAQPASLRNKERVEAKRYPEDLIANKGREWGMLLT